MPKKSNLPQWGPQRGNFNRKHKSTPYFSCDEERRRQPPPKSWELFSLALSETHSPSPSQCVTYPREFQNQGRHFVKLSVSVKSVLWSDGRHEWRAGIRPELPGNLAVESRCIQGCQRHSWMTQRKWSGWLSALPQCRIYEKTCLPVTSTSEN